MLTFVRGWGQTYNAFTSTSATAWATSGNWALSHVPSNTEVARFNALYPSNQSQINLGSVTPNILGVEVSSARTTPLTIGANTATSGSMTLIGTTINGVANTVLRNASSSLVTFGATGGTGVMSILLANSTDNIINIDGNGGITVTYPISGVSRKLTKAGIGSGILTVTGANTYSGGTTLTNGEMRFNPSANLNQSGVFNLNGGILGTIGITANRAIIFSSLTLTENSIISLATSTIHTLTFTTAGAFTSNKTITINGWQGIKGASGTAGKIFVGSSAASLSATQLAQINFTGYDPGATLLSTGEVVPSSIPTYAVSYNGNTNSGGTAPTDPSSPYVSGATVTVLGAGTLVKTGFNFTGWNTAADGSGTAYAPGATFAMPASAQTLYAQWSAISTLNPPFLTVASNATVDNPFAVTFTDNASWRAAITKITVGGSELSAGYAVTAGNITFTPSASVPANLLQQGGTKTIVVKATGYSDATVSQPINAGAPVKIVISKQPAGPTVNGGALVTQPILDLSDQYNNPTGATSATATASVGAGAWTLGGTTAVSSVGSSITYSNLTATSAAEVIGATMVFSAPGFPSVTSVPFNIPGPPSPILGVTGNTNYGSVCIGSLASQTYTITNTGTVAASGVSVVSSNNSEFTVSGLSSTTIAGNGGTATYNVTFNPSAAGTRTSTVTVTSTTSGSNSVVNNLTGTGVTAINGAVQTNPVGTTSARSAGFSGTVTSVGSCPAITNRGFVYAVTSDNATPTIGGTGVTDIPEGGTTATTFNNTPNNLLPSTQYSYRSYVLNGAAITYGAVVDFTTLPALAFTGGNLNHGSSCPTVSATPIIYPITNNSSVTVTGITVTSSNNTEFVVGGTPATSLAPGATTTYSITFTPSSSGIMSSLITVTSSQQTISNTVMGTGISSVAQAVTTSAATAVTTTTATLNGNVTTLGVCPASIEKGFVYSGTSTNNDPLIAGTGVTKVAVPSVATGAFNTALASLPNGTSYSYKAYIYNGTAYTYGAVQTFTTLAPPVNDLCANATALTFGNTSNGTLANSTFTSPFTKKDVWYKFTPTCTAIHPITVTGFTGDVDIEVFSNSGICPSSTTVFASSAGSTSTESITDTPFTSGVTYYIRVLAFSVAAETSAFTINITAPTPTAATVTTGAVSLNTTGSTATLNASAATFGVCPTTTVKGFVIARTSDNATPTVGGANTVNEVVTTLGTSGAFSKAVTALSVNTGYSYQAYLYDGTTYTYGGVVTFTTPLVSLSTDYFRSNVINGNWATPATWESSATGGASPSEWMVATLAPTASATNILIRQGHTITSAVANTSRNLTIDATGTLILNNNFTLNGANLINGTLTRNSGSATFTNNSSSLTFGPNSIYNHNVNNAAIPTATWNVSSSCNITGVTTAITLSSLNQSFGNFTWNNGGQTSFINLDASVTNFSVSGTFSVLNTGTPAVKAFSFNNASSTSKNYTINNFLIAGTSQVQMSFLTGTNVPVTTLNILGDLTLQDSAVLDFGASSGNGPVYSGSNRYRSVIKLAGHLLASPASSLLIGNNASYGVIEFTNTTVKNVSIQNANTNSILFEVLPTSSVALQSNLALDAFNGFDVEGTLDLGTHTIIGADGDLNYFYNYPNSTLRIANADGITSLLTYPTTGAVRVDGNDEDYDIDGNYVYYGTSNQNTGNGLPAIVKNISIENTGAVGNNEITLTNAELGVTEDLRISNGIFNISDKEVYGGGVETSELRINADSELKIGGTRTFPLAFGTVTFAPRSIVHYAGINQAVINKNVLGYSNLPNYENLRITGTGLKTAAIGETAVNIKTYVDSAELVIPRSEDNVDPVFLTSKKGIFVAAGGKATFKNNAQLMQDADATNSGKIAMEREAKIPISTFNQFVYWSSPVIGQNFKTIYGGSTDAMFYNETNNRFVTSSGAYIAGRGLAVKNPVTANSAGVTSTATFAGTPYNNDLNYNLAFTNADHGYNLVGNPYPSNLDLNTLYANNLTAIESTFRFWDNTNNAEQTQLGSTYNGSSYAIYNALSGPTGTGIPAPGSGSGSPDNSGKTPNNILKVGQGFLVRAKVASAVLGFKGTQRITAQTNAQFYGKASDSIVDRYLIELVTPSNLVFSNAVVYFDNGNNSFTQDDSKFDAGLSEGLFTKSDEEKVVINGRSIFTNNDIIKLGSRNFIAGNNMIRLGTKEGVFANGQNVYLKDKQAGIITNLSQGSYTFSADTGEINNRFEIIYKPEAVLASDAVTKESLQVYRSGENFIVKSGHNKIDSVEVYDVTGRLVKSVKGNSSEIIIEASSLSSGMYILNINRNNQTINKKIIK